NPLIIAFSLVSLGFFIFELQFIRRTRSVKKVTGVDEMIGATAEVLELNEKGYRVRCHGEIWYADSNSVLEIGQKVRVESLSGLVLHVNPIKE
ncbi:MAG: NfeD family protein, partial [Sulfurovum sp.]